MIYQIIKNRILRGKIEDLENRIDVFYAAGKLTNEQYNELIAMLLE